MIKSMTGYGKAEVNLPSGKITIEIRTLNGKNADVSIKTFLLPKDKELSVRQEIATSLQRGTIDFFISFEQNAASSSKQLNGELVKEYFSQAQAISKDLGIAKFNDSEVFDTILNYSDVRDAKKDEIITEEDWPEVDKAISTALAQVCEYRDKEGLALYKDITSRVSKILDLDNQVEAFEPERMEAVKTKIQKALDDLQAKPDKSRFEEEMVYYLEKLDINEEKVRLRQHCKYFMDTIDGEAYPGKKLGFIIQEMGREINTTGSKANHAGMQKLVVQMKDELEKIREQSLNIL
ncbi:MAG: YicC/YloC family endoribonuclease [Bacteroidales bacterium]